MIIGQKAFLIIACLLFFNPIVKGEYIHFSYDWEGDNGNEQLPGPFTEACYACHYGGMSATAGQTRSCEDCHTINATTATPNGPYTFYRLGSKTEALINFTLRRDYNNSVLVYSHLSFSDRRASNYSSCLTYDPETGEGVCHGVSYARMEKAGGYFAFNESGTKEFARDDPYLRTFSGFLPNTTSCLFCHAQRSDDIRDAWGSPSQIRLSGIRFLRHYNSTTNEDCLRCHVRGAGLRNFHSLGIYVERKGYRKWVPRLLILLALALIGVGGYISRSKKEKKIREKGGTNV